jgi:hypothetical protein
LPRLVRLTRGYSRSAQRLGAHAPGITRQRVAAAIRQLTAAPSLPLPGDVEALIPPTLVAHVHRVQGTGLWLWYIALDTELVLRALTNIAPG